MLSVYQIERQLRLRHWDVLLRGIVPLGMELPLPLHIRLSQQPVAVMGLALRRVCELTYGPTAVSRDIACTLLAEQRSDGSFGVAGPDPLATAAAINALTLLETSQPNHGLASVPAAIDRALLVLAAMQDDDGLFNAPDDRTEDDRATTASFVLAILAGNEAFRRVLRFADLMTWFDERADSLPAPTADFWRLARIDTPVDAHPSPQLTAIAA